MNHIQGYLIPIWGTAVSETTSQILRLLKGEAHNQHDYQAYFGYKITSESLLNQMLFTTDVRSSITAHVASG